VPAHLVAMLCFAQIPTVEDAQFSHDAQIAAVTATVRLVDRKRSIVGSGVVVGHDKEWWYLLTASHLVEAPDQLEIQLYRDKDFPRPFEVVAKPEIVARSSKLRDLVLLRIPIKAGAEMAVKWEPKEMPEDKPPLHAMAIGCESGQAPKLTITKVLAAQPGKQLEDETAVLFWEVAEKHAPGRSGGPLVDAKGRLLGICSGTNKEKTYYVHWSEIGAFFKEERVEGLIGPEQALVGEKKTVCK
jgi:S1-C subfamily serine protease